jgi:hypothetical protein
MVQYKAFKESLAATASERLNAFLRQNTVLAVEKNKNAQTRVVRACVIEIKQGAIEEKRIRRWYYRTTRTIQKLTPFHSVNLRMCARPLHEGRFAPAFCLPVL